MKFFIDTADVNEIRKANEMGVLDGVTTNPSLIAKTGRDFHEVLLEICSIVDGPISAEVVSLDAEGMIAEGRELAKLHKNIVVKIPMTTEGLKATKALSSEGIRVNVTLIFSPAQGLLAAKAGATYASPFIGRLDDISHEGMDLIASLVQIYENYDYDTQVLAASCRHPLHVVQSAELGAHVATIPFSVIDQLAKHPLTDIGLKKFLADWERVPKALKSETKAAKADKPAKKASAKKADAPKADKPAKKASAKKADAPKADKPAKKASAKKTAKK